METLKFEAQHNWTVADLWLFLNQLNNLYNRLYIIDQLGFNVNINLSSIIRRPTPYVPSEKQLVVDYINICSPGKFSFKGEGKIIKQLRSLMKDICYENPHQRKMNELKFIEQAANMQREQKVPEEAIQEFVRDAIRNLTNSTGKLSKILKEFAVFLLENDE